MEKNIFTSPQFDYCPERYAFLLKLEKQERLQENSVDLTELFYYRSILAENLAYRNRSIYSEFINQFLNNEIVIENGLDLLVEHQEKIKNKIERLENEADFSELRRSQVDLKAAGFGLILRELYMAFPPSNDLIHQWNEQKLTTTLKHLLDKINDNYAISI